MARQLATRRLLDLEAGAAYLGLTRRSLERLLARGVVQPVRLPGLRRTLVDRQDLDALVAQVKAS